MVGKISASYSTVLLKLTTHGCVNRRFPGFQQAVDDWGLTPMQSIVCLCHEKSSRAGQQENNDRHYHQTPYSP
jgi:hypothetical protein